MIQAVIFDMDGLMTDTESLHYQAFREVLGAFGVDFTEADNAKYIALTDIDAARLLVKKFELALNPETLVKRKTVIYRRLILKGVPSQPGLLPLLEYLQREGYKKAVASSSSLEEINIIVKSIGAEQYFDGLFSALQVKHGKPAPDLFLLAAQSLAVKPSNCLVLEDAPNGIAAARRAGMLRYAVPSPETKRLNFSEANRVLSNLSEVRQYLELDQA